MIRVLIADDHTIMRDGLKRLFDRTGDILVVGEAADGGETLRRLATDAPDVLVLDIGMPGGGIDLIPEVQGRQADVGVLILSMYNVNQMVLRALDLGALGYVTKDSDPGVLVGAVRAVAAGERFIAPALAQNMVLGGAGDLASLSEREFEVLRLFANGVSIAEIAETLHLSPKTVSSHKSRVMGKLRVDNDSALIKKAIAFGLTSLAD